MQIVSQALRLFVLVVFSTILNSFLASPDIAGTISYQWQSRTGSNPFTDIFDATSNEYDPIPLTSTTAFRRSASLHLTRSNLEQMI